MARRQWHLTGLTGLLLLLLPQAGTPAGAEQTETVTVHLRLLRVGEEPVEGIRFATEEAVEVPALSRFLPAGPFTYRGPARMRFVRDGAPFVPVAELSIPGGTGRALLFFSPARSGGFPYQVDLLDDDPKAFPAGCLVLLNRTGRPLLGRIGRADAILREGPSELFHGSADLPGGILVRLALPTQAGPRIVFENQVELSAAERAVLVLEPPRPSDPLRVRTCLFRERLPGRIPGESLRGFRHAPGSGRPPDSRVSRR